MKLSPRRPESLPPEPLPFGGFGRDLMPFFGELEVEQSRAWFHANKQRYDTDIREPLVSLVTDLASACAATGIPLTATPKTGMFRPNRDIRFGKDKSPYRTNAAAMLSRTGLKRSQGVLYVQAGMTGAYAAMGFYVLTPVELKAFRSHILRHAGEWRDMVAALAAAGLTLARDSETTRLPKGIDAETTGDLADAVRLKSWIVSRKLAKEDLYTPALIDRVMEFAKSGLPLLEFGWQALG